MPRLRQNIITGDWVVIAPERAKRPQDYVIAPSVKVAKKENCPFCPESLAYTKNEKIQSQTSKNIYVIQNKFPAFLEPEDEINSRSTYEEQSFYRSRPAIGDHEVVVIKNHDLKLTTFPKPLMAEMFRTIRNRCLKMREIPGVTQIMPIYNHGAEAGASIAHPHAQIFASGIVANTVGRELEGAERYYGINGVCVFCDIIKHEKKEKRRVVYENQEFIVVTHYAARFPMETWIYPKRHDSQFENSTDNKLEYLADAVLKLAKAIDKAVPNVSFNFYIHSLPVTLEHSAYYHWHLEVTPRLANYGGYELGSGVIIDIMNPEDAAGYLREKI